jgi:hypothetical protein
MAKIVDPDQLTQGDEVIFDTSAKTIQLRVFGNLSDLPTGKESGVTGKCLYSFAKEEWKTDPDLNKFRFPIKMIYEASFQLINGWTFADAQSKDLIRDAGFQDITNSTEHACIVSLGSMDDSTADQAYYDQVFGYGDNTTVQTFDKKGELNENIQINDGVGGDYTGYLKVFLREEQKLYAEYALLAEQGLAALKYEAYRLPLSNGADLKAKDSDTVIAAGTGSVTGVSYSGMAIDYLVGNKFVTGASIIANNSGNVALDDVIQDAATPARWYKCTTAGTIDATDNADLSAMGGAGTAVFEPYAGERQVGDLYYAFNRIVKCDDGALSGRVREVHSWCQYQLRQVTDINANTNGDNFGTVYGNIASPLTYFVGDIMHGYKGVYFDNLNAADNSNVRYWDITVGTFGGGNVEGVDYGLTNEFLPATSTERQNPFLASFDLVFSSNLSGELDADTQYRMYFKNDDDGDNAGRDFDTDLAIVVQDKDNNPVQGQVPDTGIVSYQYAYTTNTQRGVASAGTPAPVIVVFQGLNDSEWSEAEFTITESTGLSFACNTADELNYENPV